MRRLLSGSAGRLRLTSRVAMFGLVWLLLPTAFIGQAGLGPLGIVMTLLDLAAIGALWATLLAKPRWNVSRRVAAIGLIAAGGLILAATLGPGWGVVVVFATTAAAWTLDRRRALAVILALPVAVIVADLHHGGPLSGILIDVLLPPTIGAIMLALVEFLDLIDLVAHQQERLSEMAILTERNRIVRDLHDSLGHSLMTVIVKTRLLKTELRMVETADVTASLASLQAIEDTVRTAIGEVRRTVADYQSVDFTGIMESVPATLRAANITVQIDLDPRAVERVTDQPLASAALGWIMRECATNVLKHSNARHVDIRLQRSAAGPIELTVVNDGVSQTRRPASALTGSGNGVTGMRARVADIGGVLAVGHEGQHFTVGVSVPGQDKGRNS